MIQTEKSTCAPAVSGRAPPIDNRYSIERIKLYERQLSAGDHLSPPVGNGPVQPALPLLHAGGGRGEKTA